MGRRRRRRDRDGTLHIPLSTDVARCIGRHGVRHGGGAGSLVKHVERPRRLVAADGVPDAASDWEPLK